MIDHVHLEQPWAGFSVLHLDGFKIGIAITSENGSQNPEEAGVKLEKFIESAKAALRLEEHPDGTGQS